MHSDKESYHSKMSRTPPRHEKSERSHRRKSKDTSRGSSPHRERETHNTRRSSGSPTRRDARKRTRSTSRDKSGRDTVTPSVQESRHSDSTQRDRSRSPLGEDREADREASPEKDDEESANFREVMDMIAARFPAQFEQEPVKPRMASLTDFL